MAVTKTKEGVCDELHLYTMSPRRLPDGMTNSTVHTCSIHTTRTRRCGPSDEAARSETRVRGASANQHFRPWFAQQQHWGRSTRRSHAGAGEPTRKSHRRTGCVVVRRAVQDRDLSTYSDPSAVAYQGAECSSADQHLLRRPTLIIGRAKCETSVHRSSRNEEAHLISEQ